ncbi:MAG: ATP-binding protein, partial [Pseudomonadota bacterium]
SFHQMTKVDPAGLIGSRLDLHPELGQVNDIVEALLIGREDEYGGLTREFIIPGDKPTYIRATVNAVLSETGKSLGLVAVLRDVTKQKEEENEKTAFVAMLTHELRSPLGAVDTQFHVILKGLAGELTEKQRDMLTRMRKRTQNIMLMINDLLDLSRIETRQFVQEKKPTDIRAVMLETVELLSDEAAGKNLSLELKQPEFMPEVLADPSALKEVATNLISNAIHYTPPGGRVEIRTGEKNGWVTLEVEDTGWGIAKEYQERIFDRFFRIKDEHTRDVVGTGLGLPIVKAIVEDHQGTVSVQSEAGRGSIFKVELPALSLKVK